MFHDLGWSPVRAKAIGIAWIVLALAAAVAAGGAAPAPELPPVLLRADLFAQEGTNILYAIGNVRLQRGDVAITSDAAVIWTADREAYLEGHVLYRTGKSVMECERAYVHWIETKDPKTEKGQTTVDRGFFFRAGVRWNERPDKVAWYVRAEEVLQTEVRHFIARGGVMLSPCQFHEPHTFFRADEVELVADEKLIATNISYHVRGVSLPAIWVPPLYWPKLYVPLGWQWPEVNIDAGRSSRFGTYIRTEVIYPIPEKLFGVLDSHVGVRLDYFSKRGFAYGGSFRYELDQPRPEGVLGRDLLRGELSGYRVPDDGGEDRPDRYDIGLGTTDRWRAKFFHSQDLPEGLEFDFEYQHYSDAGFRQEYFEREYYDAKPIESRAYLKWSRGPLAAYLHYRWREDEWLDTTEYRPQMGFNVFSYPLWGNLLYTGHVEFANIRRLLSELRLKPGQSPSDPAHVALRRRYNFYFDPLESSLQEDLSDGRSFWRFNTYHQLSYPFHLGIFDIEPFVGARFTHYGETLDGGSDSRTMFVYGARLATQFWRSWDNVKADRFGPIPLQVDGLRHIITPELRFLSIEKPSLTLDKLILTDDTDFNQPIGNFGYDVAPRPYHPYDPVGLAFGDADAIVPVRLVNLALRNRWQTRREGKIVDLIELDANIDYYLKDKRDNFDHRWSDFRLDFRFHPIEGVTFFSDFEYCLNRDYYNADKNEFSVFNTGLHIAVSKRWELVLSQRYEANESNAFGVRLLYQVNDKWRFDIQYEHDTMDKEASNDVAFLLRRDLHDWIAEFVFENDNGGFNRLIGFRLRPKMKRELISGLEYRRDLRAGMDAYQRESYQQFDY